jgi:hypothetical protein
VRVSSLAGLLLALALLGPAVAPAAGCEEHGGSGCGLSGQYTGTWEAERVETKTEESITRKLKLTWSEGFDGQYWVLSSAGGSFSCNSVGALGEGGCAGTTIPTRRTCSGTLSLAAGGAAAFRQVQVEHYGEAGVGGFGWEPYISHNDPGNAQPFSPAIWYVSVAPPARSTILLPGPNKYEELLSSSETEPKSPCASSSTERTLDAAWTVPYGQWANGFGGPECHFVGGDTGIDWESFAAGSTHTVADNCSGSGTEGIIFGKATLAQSVTFGSPGAGGGPPGGGAGAPGQYGPEFSTAKRESFIDMREEAIPNAARYCLPAAGALALAGAGVLTTSLGPGGGILAAAGSLTASTLGPFCDATVKRLVNDWKTYRDPPLASIHVLARPAAVAAGGLPSCGRYHGSAASFCKQLRAADSKLLLTSRHAAAVAGAIEATVSRERAAHDLSDAAAVAAQDANLRKLLAERVAANAAERRAGASVAKVLKSAAIRFRITKKQSAKAIAAAERAAAAKGVTAADLRSVNAKALRPAPANLLAGLGDL